MVDAVHRVLHERFTAPHLEAGGTACLAKTAARLGVVRLWDPFGFRKEHSESGAQSIAQLYRVGTDDHAVRIFRAGGLHAGTGRRAALAPNVAAGCAGS